MDAKRQAAIAKEEAINAQCAKAFFKEHGITLEEWEEIHPKPNVAALVKRANEICPHDPEVEMESARQ